MTDRSGWVRVGDPAQWTRGRGRQVDVAGTKVAVFWDGRDWIAVDDTCLHMGASLADGRLHGGELQCSWHEWRYDVKTGQCPVRPWARVRVWEVKVEADGVWLKESPVTEPSKPDDDPDWVSWDPARYFKKGTEPER